MKKIILYGLMATALLLNSCQNELYSDATEEYKSKQGVYMVNKEPIQAFVEEDVTVDIKGLKIALAQKVDGVNHVTLEVGSQEQLDKYNKENGTEYILLPSDMYTIPKELVFESQKTVQSIPLQLKDVKFSLEGDYALPITIKDASTSIIGGEQNALVVLEQRLNTKVLRMAGYDAEDKTMFPNDFKVDQWTIEVMVKRSAYISNNRAIIAIRNVPGGSPLDGIYTRFGDVTIKTNQLQIKTAGSQIDIAADKFTAKPDEWYMIAFMYDGKTNSVYVNGNLVAEREMRTGPYGITGFWIAGANEYIREIRFWKSARSAQQLKSYAWKMVDPTDDNLLLYYPLNGKKRDASTGAIVEDETTLWDWSKNQKHLSLPTNARFDDNGGNGYIFPLPSKD